MTGVFPSRGRFTVLHVLGWPGGGSALSTVTLIEALARLGIRSCAVSPPGHVPAERERLVEATQGRVRFVELYRWHRRVRSPLWRRPLVAAGQALGTGFSYRSTAAITRFARQQGVDLVHTSTILTPEGRRAAERLGVPHVWSVRELVGEGQPFRFVGEHGLLPRRMHPADSVFVANSETCRTHLAHLLPDAEIRVIPNGTELAPLLDLPAPRPEGRTVGMVASLATSLKRHDLFLRAAAQLPDDIELRLIGKVPDGGDYLASLRTLADQLGLGDRLVIPGPTATPAEAMAQIDVLVHPSPNESFGRVLIEAMAAARPVVAVDSGGSAELVEHGRTGLLAAPGDVDSLAACTRKILDDPALAAELGAEGRRTAIARWSAESMAAAFGSLYEELLDPRPEARR